MCQYMNMWLNKSILSPGVGVRQFPLWKPLRTSYSQEGQAFLYFTSSVCVCLCAPTYVYMSICMGVAVWHPFHIWEAAFGCLLCPECHLSLLLPHFHIFITELLCRLFVFLVRILIFRHNQIQIFFLSLQQILIDTA